MKTKEFLRYDSANVLYRDLSDAKSKHDVKRIFLDKLFLLEGCYFYLIDSENNVHTDIMENESIIDELLFMSSIDAGAEASTFLLLTKKHIPVENVGDFLTAIGKKGGLINPANRFVLCGNFDGNLLYRDNDGERLLEMCL